MAVVEVKVSPRAEFLNGERVSNNSQVEYYSDVCSNDTKMKKFDVYIF